MFSNRARRKYRARIHAYAASEVWRARSLMYKRKVSYVCAGCGLRSHRNHTHHLDYTRAFYGTEPDSDLMCLCGDCHRKVHAYARRHRGLTLRAATWGWLASGRRKPRSAA